MFHWSENSQIFVGKHATIRRRFIPMSLIMKSQVVLSQVDFYHLISIYHLLSAIFDHLLSQFLIINRNKNSQFLLGTNLAAS